ncbi:Platelet-activating factor acetylhydrolase, isoform II [Amycolatopsis xylanica]|uniref:Platelet-activating factor acetylhydrolase, isoform II n=1 Tax=Amycolatopsis xylanica TaxID=589385 RepID=A0A1H3AMG0_9PSEU|nr:alpha/beta hydrolase [Amycolatopsis xylanica]SDX30892.1 Platelet-activating factor acetylhydrolase, isoform II [Amycolatopsis xylanica]
MPAVSAAEADTAGLSLPAPTGRDAVGRSTLALTDRNRTDPWVPEAGPRQLMVTLFYPAVRGTGSRASYVDADEAAALAARFHTDPPVFTAEKLAGTRTWSRVGANPLPGKRPLVLLSPGFTVPRHTLTALAEDLASRGYVAAAVDHAFESSAAKFPGGVLPCAACGLPEKIGRAAIALSRGKDLSFVLDELRDNPMIDERQVAVVGHSLGGAAAATAMRADRRVGAGVNLDGPMEPVAPLDRPFLLVGSPEIHDPAATKDPSWDAVWPLMTGWKRRLTVAGADHYAFTDLDLLVQQAGFEEPFPLDPALGIRLTRAHVAAFLDRQLCGGASPTMGLGAADIVG